MTGDGREEGINNSYESKKTDYYFTNVTNFTYVTPTVAWRRGK